MLACTNFSKCELVNVSTLGNNADDSISLALRVNVILRASPSCEQFPAEKCALSHSSGVSARVLDVKLVTAESTVS